VPAIFFRRRGGHALQRFARPTARPKANAPPPGCLRGVGAACPFFPSPPKRNGAPGGAGELRYGSPVVPGISSEHRRTLPERGFAIPPFGRVCETRPEARAGDDLRACETLLSSRCASRRSTGRLRSPASRPRVRLAWSPAPLSRPACVRATSWVRPDRQA